MSEPPWVLIDLSYLAHRAMHSVGHLAFEDMGPTGVLFGFFTQLRLICGHEKVRSNKVCIFFDSRKSYRKKAYPDYKGKRQQEKTGEEIAQLNLLHDQQRVLRTTILPEMGISVYRQTGVESDDLMAQAASQFTTGKERKAVIITADHDLFQCVTRRVHWFDAGRSKYYSPENFKAEKGIGPARWGEVKTLAGCHSDNVKGIPGIGEGTAIKYLLGTLPMHHKTWSRINSLEGTQIAARNRGLVVLPHQRTKPIVLKEPDYKPDMFFKHCRRYGLQSFLTQSASWLAFFRNADGSSKPQLRRRGFSG